jgi:hypothetical protein
MLMVRLLLTSDSESKAWFLKLICRLLASDRMDSLVKILQRYHLFFLSIYSLVLRLKLRNWACEFVLESDLMRIVVILRGVLLLLGVGVANRLAEDYPRIHGDLRRLLFLLRARLRSCWRVDRDVRIDDVPIAFYVNGGVEVDDAFIRRLFDLCLLA